MSSTVDSSLLADDRGSDWCPVLSSCTSELYHTLLEPCPRAWLSVFVGNCKCGRGISVFNSTQRLEELCGILISLHAHIAEHLSHFYTQNPVLWEEPVEQRVDNPAGN